MRAGANEFFPWTPATASQAARAMEESFHGAVRRTAARREAATAGAQAAVRDARVPRRQGRRRHDDGGGQLRGRARAPDQAADDHRRPEDLASARSRCSSASVRASRCSTRSRTCTGSTRTSCSELVAKHKSGLDILAGSEQFDRPNAQDAGAIEELLRVLDARLRLRRHRRRQHDQRRASVVGALRRRHDLPGRPIPTCRRSATRSAWSIACVSSAPAASGSRSC